MLGSIGLLWGTALWAMVRSLRLEDRKVRLLREQGELEPYSPRALAELGAWLDANPQAPYADVARDRYNECVEVLQRIDKPFYAWPHGERARLQRR